MIGNFQRKLSVKACCFYLISSISIPDEHFPNLNLSIDFRNRKGQDARIQKQWVKEQIDEKEAIKNHLAQEDVDYAN